MMRKSKGSSLSRNESAFYAQVREVIVEARRYVHKTANAAMVKAYWLVGKMIVEKQGGDERAQYGDQLVRGLSERLTMEFGSGFTLSNLKTMRKFYRCFPIGHTLCDQLSWSHYRLLITVEDEELIVAFLDMVENHKMIVENSGLLTVAALRHLDFTGKKVVSILSGGNMDVITMSSVVQHGLIQRDRIFTVSVLLPDRPGELVNVAQVIAELAQTRQVIVVTHLAQLAVVAQSHYVVRKSETSDDGLPVTSLVEVSGEDRVREVARLLSGDEDEATIEHARVLLDKAGER